MKPVLPGLPGSQPSPGITQYSGPYGRGLRQKPHGSLYLYLSRPEFVDEWLNGGVVPFFPARKYLSDERKGILTPDEILQEDWEGLDREQLAKVGFGFETGYVQDVQIIDCAHGGRGIPNSRVDSYFEDAALFCCSRFLSRELMERFEKRAVVEIVDINTLINQIEDTVRKPCRFGYVKYTNTKKRSHFLKSREDRWQREYRIVIPWTEQSPVTVKVPAGIANIIDLQR